MIIICFCSCPCRSSHGVLKTFNKTNAILYPTTFCLLYESKTVIALKVKPRRQSIVKECTSGYRQHSFTKKQSQHDKHRQHRTELGAKGIDPIWHQICASLLHYQFKDVKVQKMVHFRISKIKDILFMSFLGPCSLFMKVA